MIISNAKYENPKPEPFDIEELPAADAMKDHPELWLTAKGLLPELTDDQLALVVSLAADNCHVCHADSADCQCWNDE